MNALTVRQKAQLALLGIWLIAGALVLMARAARPDADSVLNWLHAQTAESNSAASLRLARELPLRLSRLPFDERRRIMESPDFPRVLRSFDRDEFRAFMATAIPEGLCALLQAARRMPENARAAYLQRGLDRVRAQGAPDDPRLDPAWLKLLARRGIAMYEDEASAEDRLVMLPFIQHLSSGLEWL